MCRIILERGRGLSYTPTIKNWEERRRKRFLSPTNLVGFETLTQPTVVTFALGFVFRSVLQLYGRQVGFKMKRAVYAGEKECIT